jgi:hypothetical protein
MSTSTSAAVFESYVRTPDFESVAAHLELPPELWDIFARTERRASAAGIAGQLGVAPEIALLGLRELAAHGLLCKHVQRWHEYRRGAEGSAAPAAPAVPAPVPAPVTGAVLPAGVEPPAIAPVVPPSVVPKILCHQPAPAVSERPSSPIHTSATGAMMSPAAAPVPVPPRPAVRPLPVVAAQPREIRFTCGSKGRRVRVQAEPEAAIRFAVRRSGVVAVRRNDDGGQNPVPAEGWRLRPLLDAIVRRGGGGVQGQLLAYRVFLRVPAELLDRAGLHSLNLAEADFVIRDAELHAAIRRSMCAVAGMADDSPAEPASCTVS